MCLNRVRKILVNFGPVTSDLKRVECGFFMLQFVHSLTICLPSAVGHTGVSKQIGISQCRLYQINQQSVISNV